MIKYDIENDVLLGVNASKEERILVIPNNVKRIKHITLGKNIEEIVFSQSLIEIDPDAFEGAMNVKRITVEGNHTFALINHCLFDKVKNALLLVERSVSGELEVPPFVSNISSYAFAYCYELKSVKMSEEVRRIGEFAFYECNKLEKINLPTRHNLTLEESAFEGCRFLKEIVIPSKTLTLAKHLFFECYDLAKVTVESDKIKEIPQECFAYNESLEQLAFKDGVESIGDGAFLDCKNLKELVLPSSVKKLGIELFTEDDLLTVHSGSKIIAKYCEENGTKFQKID